MDSPVEAEGLEGTREEREGRVSGSSGQLRAHIQLLCGFSTVRGTWIECRSRKARSQVWKLLGIAIWEQVANT